MTTFGSPVRRSSAECQGQRHRFDFPAQSKLDRCRCTRPGSDERQQPGQRRATMWPTRRCASSAIPMIRPDLRVEEKSTPAK